MRPARLFARRPAFAEGARVAVAAAAAAAAAATAAATASLTDCLAGDAEFARVAASLRGRLGHSEVDLATWNEHLHDRDAKHGDRQFIWQTCREGERRIKQVAMWQWLEPRSSAEQPAPTATGVAALPGRTRLNVLVEVGSELNGHPGILHGGFTAALLDDVLGWAASTERKALKLEGATFTANLNVNYRRPVLAESVHLVEVRVDRVEKEKKVFLSATVSDAEGRVCVEATSLYIVVKPKPL
jgi:uncharacterized protein (TIGR00369 family)